MEMMADSPFDSRVIVDYLSVNPVSRLIPEAKIRAAHHGKTLGEGAGADGIRDAAASVFLERKRDEKPG